MTSSAPTVTTTASSPTPIWIGDDEIDCEWIVSKMKAKITELDDRYTNVKLTRAKVDDISNQQRKGERPRDGATLLLTLTFEQEGRSVGTMKKTFVIKQVSNSGLALSRQLGLAREAFFFNDLAPKIIGRDDADSSSNNIIIPKIYYAYGKMEEGTKIIIMEDLSNGYIDSGILFGKGNPNNWNRNLVEKIEQAYPKRSAPASDEVANQTFLAIAKVHATYWKDQSLLSPSSTSASYLRGALWLQGKQQESWMKSQGLIQGIWEKLTINDKNGDGGGANERIKWDPLVKQLVQKAVDGISWESQQQRLNFNTHWTLVHGDFWPGNIMLSTTTTDEKNLRLRLLDWEMTGLPSPLRWRFGNVPSRDRGSLFGCGRRLLIGCLLLLLLSGRLFGRHLLLGCYRLLFSINMISGEKTVVGRIVSQCFAFFLGLKATDSPQVIQQCLFFTLCPVSTTTTRDFVRGASLL